jgi:hypothetical protein
MSNKRNLFLSLILIDFLLITLPAFANGIPVIFAVSVVHILLINSFVIVVEYVLLLKLSTKRIRVLFLIVANLASLILAYALTTKLISSYFHNQWFGLEGHGKIERKAFVRGVLFFILLTILIEWPFYHLAQKSQRSWLISLKLSTIINLITNIPIALFYLFSDLYYDPGD